jgi:hypothetical protein
MKIQLQITKENKDGSADAIVHFDKEGLETLVQHGLISLITKAIDEYKVKPEEYEVIIQKARQLIKDHHEPTFTGNLASTLRKSNRARSTKRHAGR